MESVVEQRAKHPCTSLHALRGASFILSLTPSAAVSGGSSTNQAHGIRMMPQAE